VYGEVPLKKSPDANSLSMFFDQVKEDRNVSRGERRFCTFAIIES